MKKKISVILPTYNRPFLLLQSVESLWNVAVDYSIELILMIDGDKDSENLVQNFFDKQGGTGSWDVIYNYSEERRGGASCLNLGLEISSGNIILPASDDIIFYPNFLNEALKCHEQDLEGYGVVALNDKYQNGDILGTMWIFDRKFCIDYLGGVVISPVYNHFYGDNELTERAKLAKRYKWCKTALVEHLHPDNGKRERDYLDIERSINNYMHLDQQVYMRRREEGFPDNFAPSIKN